MPRLAIVVAVLCLLAASAPGRPAAGYPTFRTQEIEANLGIGYAVAIADVNGDRKPDVVAVNEKQVAWYENPSWAKHVIVSEGMTPRDNVCIAATDLDGGGPEGALLALGAFWQPNNTVNSGSVHYLARQGDPARPWKVVNLEAEPTVHRMRWADVDGDGKKELVVAPLQGRGTKGPDWQGEGVRLYVYYPPADPARDPWRRELVDDTLHVAHNIWPVRWDGGRAEAILVASFEGIHLFQRSPTGAWSRTKLAEGDQQSRPNRGCSEVKLGRLPGGARFLATIEPWHGNAVVLYFDERRRTNDQRPMGHRPPETGLWRRRVLDDTLRGGHGLWCADLDGDGADEVIAGWREAAPGGKVGIRIYRATDPRGEQWETRVLDDGGMACEDLAAADLTGAGRIDIVASGRATHNLRIYFNDGK
jgi:hypothetical protein